VLTAPAETRGGGEPQVEAPAASRELLVGAGMCMLLALLVCLSLYGQRPPAAVLASAPPDEFSSGRAMRHLEAIAQRPHPLGSAGHAAVRDYIVGELEAAGLKPEVQRTTAVDTGEGGHFRAAAVQNIIATLPGTDSSKAVMLVGHYDSVPNGPGASDDGAAVAAMLETLRALRAVSPLKNDVVFLFTDGEEAGLLGAHAFVTEHPLAKDVGLVLNFEARGNSGPSMMFETSAQNGWIIREFARAAPRPVAHSLSYEIYKRLPNDTDLTVFKKAGMAGLNFAYIGGLTSYHVQLDSVDNIDERSLQHHGSYALALARHFGGLRLDATRAPDAVYFDILGLLLVRYAGAWALPLGLAVAACFVGLLVAGLRRGRLRLSGLLWGALALPSSLIAAPLLVTLVWSLIQRWWEVPGVRPQGEAYGSDVYLLGFVACTVAVTATCYALFLRKVSAENLTAGGLVWWALLTGATALFLPGASFLLAWPLLFNLPAFAYMVAYRDWRPNSPVLLLLLFVGAAAGCVLWAPVIYQTFVGLTLNSIGVVMAMLVLLLGLLSPQLRLLSKPNRWALPAASALTAGALLAAAVFVVRYDERRPRLDTLLYGLNADAGSAAWASSDQEPDAWTRQFLRDGSEKKPLTEVFSRGSVRPFLSAQAPVEPLAAPQLALVGDDTNGDVRTLRMIVTSPRRAPVVSVFLDSTADVLGASVNGKRIAVRKDAGADAGDRFWDLRYYSVPQEGVELIMELRSNEPVHLRVVDQSYGLPGQLGQPRPPGFIPAPRPYNDSTFVSKSFVL
ncbi:MAG: M28 family metallopeptidase, partial [Pyrinomonadaceae bacterium]